MSEEKVIDFVVIALVILSTAYHEAAHAYTATYLGDPTPGRHGRLTLNPIPHLKPVITALVLPLIMYMTSGNFMILAQTPIDPSRFRKPLRDHALVALAGPATNLLLAAVMIGICWIPGVWHYDYTLSYPMAILPQAAFMNVVLAIFNLLPLPPLDGYWIARSFLPLRIRRETDNVARSSITMIIAMLVGGRILGYLFRHGALEHFQMLLPTKIFAFL